MPMSSYEVVKRAIGRTGPDRLPLNFPSLGRADLHAVPNHRHPAAPPEVKWEA